MLAQVALIAQIASAASVSACVSAAAPALDHAIIVVRDLDRAAKTFRTAGFRIKAGRLHANGLLNRHIKFRDGTEIELMTVHGSAGDEMARDYADLLEAGEGGVYVALRARNVATVQREAASLGLDTRRSSSGVWPFLSFGRSSPAAAVFFTSGDVVVTDADSIFQHVPRVTALAEVWLEGGPELGQLLRRLGARVCDTITAVDGRIAQRYGLSSGTVVLLPVVGNARPRVLGAVLETPTGRRDKVQPHGQFWIQYRAQH